MPCPMQAVLLHHHILLPNHTRWPSIDWTVAQAIVDRLKTVDSQNTNDKSRCKYECTPGAILFDWLLNRLVSRY